MLTRTLHVQCAQSHLAWKHALLQLCGDIKVSYWVGRIDDHSMELKLRGTADALGELLQQLAIGSCGFIPDAVTIGFH